LTDRASLAPPRRPPARTAPAGALLVYASLAVLWFRDSWFHASSDPKLIGVSGDPGFFTWNVAWVHYAIAHGQNPVYTHHLMAPAGANLLESPSIIAPSAVLAPVTALTSPVTSYNVLATAAVALSCWAAYLVCRRFTTSKLAAFVGGLVYGFSPYMQSQSLSHMNFAVALFPPFALALLHELYVRQQRSPVRVGALLGAGAFLQLLTGSELLATTVIMAFVLTTILVVVDRDAARARARHARRGLAVAGAVALVLGGGFVLFSVFGPQHVAALRQPRNTYVTDPLGFVVPSRYQWLSTSGLRSYTDGLSGFDGEFSAYVGLPLLAIIAVTAWRRRSDRVTLVAVAMFVASLILSLGGLLHVGGHKLPIPLPWIVFTHVPVLEDILPSRLMVFAFLAAAVVVALFIDDVLERAKGRTVAWVGVGTVLLSLLPVLTPPSSTVIAPSFFSTAAVEQVPAGATVLATPILGDSRVPMMWQYTAGFRFRLAQGAAFTKRGYGTPRTPLYRFVTAIEGGHPRAQPSTPCADADAATTPSADCERFLLADLRELGISAVVVGDGPHVEELRAFFQHLLAAPPVPTGGIDLWIVGSLGP
jgi:hypothetical protein